MISPGHDKICHEASHIRGFLGLDHIAVAVFDLADARHTYEKLLGADVSATHQLPTRGLETFFAKLGETTFELMAPSRVDSEVGKFLERRGAGIHHICLRVANLSRALADLSAQGARLVRDSAGSAIQQGARGEQVAFVHPKSTQGVLLELLESSDFSSASH